MILLAENGCSTLIGTVMEIQSRWLNVKSKKDKTMFNFRIGRNTMYIPHRYPYPGERVRVEYLYHRGAPVAFSVALLEGSTEQETKLRSQRVDHTPKPSVTSSSAKSIVTVNATSTNIRSGAGNEFPPVCTVKQEDKLVLLGEHGEWFNVRLENGQEGWISNRFVK